MRTILLTLATAAALFACAVAIAPSADANPCARNPAICQ